MFSQYRAARESGSYFCVLPNDHSSKVILKRALLGRSKILNDIFIVSRISSHSGLNRICSGRRTYPHFLSTFEVHSNSQK